METSDIGAPPSRRRRDDLVGSRQRVLVGSVRLPARYAGHHGHERGAADDNDDERASATDHGAAGNPNP